MSGQRLCLTLLVVSAASGVTAADNCRWWPVQTPPKTIVRTVPWQQFGSPGLAHQMMVQSVAGLAAKAVNEGRGDELVWVGTDHVDIEEWLRRMLASHPQVEERGVFQPWELVDRYRDRGVVRGYILYTQDASSGDLHKPRPGINDSVNVATSMAGLLDGILVEEKLEKQAQAHGLKMLLDARDKSQSWCFDTYKSKFNRHMLCTQDPRVPNIRDLAIAQKAFTICGQDALFRLPWRGWNPRHPSLVGVPATNSRSRGHPPSGGISKPPPIGA